MPAILLAQMMQARQVRADRQFGAQLRGDKRVDHAAEQVAVPQQRRRVEPERRDAERGIDEIPLG